VCPEADLDTGKQKNTLPLPEFEHSLPNPAIHLITVLSCPGLNISIHEEEEDKEE
jgi:hypothetical protein